MALIHLAHQYDMYRIPNVEWYWIVNHRRKYATGARGDMIKDLKIEVVPHYEKGKYDLAILHLDQQCFDEGLWMRGKGSMYRELNEMIQDIPKIVIMHGTPYMPENDKFSCDITEENYKDLGFSKEQIGMSSELINRCKKAIGNNVMVVNSYRARQQWGFGNTIIHGMDPDDWKDLRKEPRVVTMINPAGLDAYYDRDFLAAVKDELLERDIYHCHITVDASFQNWDEYRNFLGRSLIYFNPTKESPMPRARTEALFSGCCVVTTGSQDADTFIENGVNGFIIERDAEKTADLIESLIYDYQKAVTIGQSGKKTAMEIFHKDRYIKDWENLISKTIDLSN